MNPDYGMPVHPVCDLFPLMDAGSLAGLATDIKANGLLSAIVLHQGQIVDGRQPPAGVPRVGRGTALRGMAAGVRRRHAG